MRYLLSLLSLSLLAATTQAILDNGPSAGTFQNPAARTRPRFRYWLPDASVDPAVVAQDISDVGRIGAGGVELLGYYAYGDIEAGATSVPTDWTKYGWGTPAWRAIQDAALYATKDNGLIIDLSLGPNQGAGVPAPYDDEGLRWDLQPFNVTVVAGTSYSDVLPGWGTGPLVSASTSLVKQAISGSITTYILSAASMEDVTSQVGADGHLNLTLPSDAADNNYTIFAYYLIQSHYREQQTPLFVTPAPQTPITSFVENGSYVVDHYSTHGAETVAHFWNTYLLNGSDSAQLVKEVGNYVWEDSQEYPANIEWTPKLSAIFLSKRGYNISKWLPVIFTAPQGGNVHGDGGLTVYVTDEEDAGNSHVVDYQQTITELNADYLKALTQFAGSIGTQSSAQVVYNLPMDMLANIPNVNAPECESLGFNNDIDVYRQYAGPANLAGKSVISSECGAKPASAYQLHIPELLYEIKRSVVGGVNNFVLHGHPYGGWYPNTTWPGYTTFTYQFAEMHNRHLPAWDFYGEWMNYVARLQWVARSGIPKVDLALYQKRTSYTAVPTSYGSADLEDAGYSYEYLSPDNFDLPAAVVADGVLAPSKQAFKAIIVRQSDDMTALGLTKLNQWASEGLPVILAGGLPSNFEHLFPMSTATAQAELQRLSQSVNAHVVPLDGLAESIVQLGILPRIFTAPVASNLTTWYSRLWEAHNGSTIYTLIYNDATGTRVGEGSGSRNVTIAATGTPFLYDALTGAETKLSNYEQRNGTIVLPLTLAGNQTALFAFKQQSSEPDSYGSAIADQRSKVAGTPAPLTKWTLTVEAWEHPADLYDINGTVKTNHTYQISDLVPWNQLTVANLTYVSGRGYYKTSFTWPPSDAYNSSTGATVDLGSIVHTAVLYINGQRLPPLDVTHAVADITSHLKTGQNELEVVVATPYGNSLYPVWDQLRSAGDVPLAAAVGGSLIALDEYGLVGEVVVTPYSSE